MLPPHIRRYFATVAPAKPPPITTTRGAVVAAPIPMDAGSADAAEAAPRNLMNCRLFIELIIDTLDSELGFGVSAIRADAALRLSRLS